MTYPLSSDVSSGQPTAYQHYNNLRGDALYLGQADDNAVPLGDFFQRYADNVKLQYLATNRIRAPHSTTRPATIMVKGVMLQSAANVDLASNAFSGGAAVWYIFAKQTAGSTTFTLEVNTSNAESATNRLIGEVYWDGTNIDSGTIKCYIGDPLPAADYDSGWFSVANGQVYTKAHSLGQAPRLVVILHSNVPAPAAGTELIPVMLLYDGTITWSTPLGFDTTNIYVQTGLNDSWGTLYGLRRLSGAGYYRLFAWR
jgi:hypothetical protein